MPKRGPLVRSVKKRGAWATAALVAIWTTPTLAAPSPQGTERSATFDSRVAIAFSDAAQLSRLGASVPRAPAEASVPVVLTLAEGAWASGAAGTLALAPGVEEELARSGVELAAGRGGPLGRAGEVAATLRASRWREVLLHPAVERVELDGSLVRSPPPLHHTATLVGADLVRSMDVAGSGEGIVVCDLDTGVDVFHPMFFRADGGFFDWRDVNGNGVLDPGGDTIELGDGPVELRSENGIVSHFADQVPVFDTQLAPLDLRYDYFFADTDGDKKRDRGRGEGYDDASPSFGEPYFVGDDVNANGRIDLGEKIAMLRTSKIRAFRYDGVVYRRGKDLIDAPFTPDMQHGTGAAGILVGGQVGLGHLVGIAPDADLVMATDTEIGGEFARTNFCLDEGARVVLHEYAPWVGHSLDGSSHVEALIDATTLDGVTHVNPVGNLSGSQKAAKVRHQGETVLPLTLPSMGAKTLAVTLLWPDASRGLTVELVGPDGVTHPLAAGALLEWEGHTGFVTRDVSSRGTTRLDLTVFAEAQLTPGTWTLVVRDLAPAPPMELHAFAYDDASGWGLGLRFTESVSEDHLVAWPATADHAIGVAAYRGHEFDEGIPQGARAPYSGRGRRIDGARALSLSAPDNPIAPGRFEDRPLAFVIYGGTSGASPHVAGAAALLTALEPELDGREVRARLEATALADAFTGELPNDDFGFGKLDVYRALTGKARPLGTSPRIEPMTYVMERGVETEIPLFVDDDDDDPGSLVVELDRDYDGEFEQRLPSATFTARLDELEESVVKVRVTDPSGRRSTALVRLRNGGSGGSDGADPESGFDVGGGGCALSRPAASPTWGLLVVAAAAGLQRLRRVLRGARRGAHRRA
jgi:subtilisin family serine protease